MSPVLFVQKETLSTQKGTEADKITGDINDMNL